MRFDKPVLHAPKALLLADHSPSQILVLVSIDLKYDSRGTHGGTECCTWGDSKSLLGRSIYNDGISDRFLIGRGKPLRPELRLSVCV